MNADTVAQAAGSLALRPDNPLLLAVLFAAFSLTPILMLGTTSFVKISVVLGILRNALGAGQIPSPGLTSLLALALTLHVMAPTARRSADAFLAEVPMDRGGAVSQPEGEGNDSDLIPVGQLLRGVKNAAVPLRCFLAENAGGEERLFFLEAHKNAAPLERQSLTKPRDPSGEAQELNGCRLLEGETFASLVPAFVISELKTAFAVGFRLFIPFLVIDLVIANILMGLGMMMVSPASVSLPFKLLLFVLSDGWLLLCQSLVLGYY